MFLLYFKFRHKWGGGLEEENAFPLPSLPGAYILNLRKDKPSSKQGRRNPHFLKKCGRWGTPWGKEACRKWDNISALWQRKQEVTDRSHPNDDPTYSELWTSKELRPAWVGELGTELLALPWQFCNLSLPLMHCQTSVAPVAWLAALHTHFRPSRVLPSLLLNALGSVSHL